MSTKREPGTDDRLARIHEQLTSAVRELTQSDAWLRMLRVASRFPTYSPSNVLLIAMQRPDATNVAGLRTWNSLGRRVRRGEKGVAILAPCLYKQTSSTVVADQATAAAGADEEGNRVLRGFRVVHVFDVTQTDGEPLPAVAPTQLRGPVPPQLWESLTGLVERDGFRLERGPCGRAYGHTRFDDRCVRIRGDVDPAQACKTLAHEIGHIRADHEGRFAGTYQASVACRGLAEVEAESIAFVVTAAAGLDSSEYTAPYVAGWSNGDLELLKKTAVQVLIVSRAILNDARLPSGASGGPRPTSALALRPSIDASSARGLGPSLR